jgi:hypothetical protein
MRASSPTTFLEHIRLRCLLGLSGLLFCQCAAPTKASPTKAPADTDASDYALTQRSASKPDRVSCRGVECPTERVPAAIGRCDAELCEGELSAAAVSKLRESAQSAHDCYESALKDQNQLEGKMMVRLRLAAGRQACDVRIEQSSFSAPPAFTRCVIERLQRTEARPEFECVDVALPLSFVRQEVEATPGG